MANEAIRKAVKDEGMHLWQLSDVLGVSEATITRWMRHEMPSAKQADIIKKIDQYRKGSSAK